MRISDWISYVCSSDLRYARARDKFDQQRPARRCLQIFDDMRLDPGVADHGQCIARGPTPRVMVDDDVGHFALRQQQVSSARRGPDRQSTRLTSSHSCASRTPSTALTKKGSYADQQSTQTPHNTRSTC